MMRPLLAPCLAILAACGGQGAPGADHADAATVTDARRGTMDAHAVVDAPARRDATGDTAQTREAGAKRDGEVDATSGDASQDHAVEASGASLDALRRDAGSRDTGPIVPPLPPLPAGAGTGTTYYVSPTGSDSNPGTSEAAPWQTLTKVTSTSLSAGDTVLLQGGATFSGCPSFLGTKITSTVEAPFTVGSYGTGSFTLEANCSGAHAAALTIDGVSGFYLHDCILRGNGGGAEYGVYIGSPGAATTTAGVRVESCDISGFYTADTSDYGGEIFIVGAPGKVAGVQLLDNTLHGSSGPSSPDDNGISGYGTKGNITNVLYQGNEVYDVGSKPNGLAGSLGNCILAIGVDGGLVQYNVVHGCGGNTSTCGGPAGIWTYNSNDVTIQYNEAYDIKPVGAVPSGACDWDGYDLDGNVTSSTLQYNWSHDNFGVGLLSYINMTWSGNVIRYNLSQNDGQGVALGGYQASTTDLAIFNNTVYSDSDAGVLFEVGATGGGSIGGHVLDNLFYMAGGGELIDVESWSTASVGSLELTRNDYYAPSLFAIAWSGTSYDSLAAWGAATKEEMLDGGIVGMTVNPELLAPGSGGTVGGYDPSALEGYRLATGSPLIGAGLDPRAVLGIDAGATDYFGDPIPGHVGTGYNVGADGNE